jgi:hypothetical protein
MTKFKTVWFWNSGIEISNTFLHVMSFFDDSYPKPSFISGVQSPSHVNAHSFNSLGWDGNIIVNLVSDDFYGSSNLWYVYAKSSISGTDIASVVAYADDRYINGTVLMYDDAVKAGIKYSESVGFVRWFCEDSRIQQIFVDEQNRRKRISTKLISIADIMIVSEKKWNGKFLNGGDITTGDGENLRKAWSESVRVTDRVGSVGPKPPDSGKHS